MKDSVIIIAITFASLLCFSLLGFYLAIRPAKINSQLTPTYFGISYENISFRTEDNILIRGWFVPNKNPHAKTIILLHGYPADKGNILPAMIFLHKHFNLLFFDFRYFGESEGSYSTVGKNEVLDLLAAIQYLKSHGINEVGIWGFSLGGAVALMAAATAPEIKAIVAESPYARLDWMAEEYYRIAIIRYPLAQLTRLWALLFLQYDIKSVTPAKTAATLKIPILIIHSKHDEVINVRHALLLKERLKNNARATLIFTDQNKHGELMQNYQEVIETFFNNNL